MEIGVELHRWDTTFLEEAFLVDPAEWDGMQRCNVQSRVMAGPQRGLQSMQVATSGCPWSIERCRFPVSKYGGIEVRILESDDDVEISLRFSRNVPETSPANGWRSLATARYSATRIHSDPANFQSSRSSVMFIPFTALETNALKQICKFRKIIIFLD